MFLFSLKIVLNFHKNLFLIILLLSLLINKEALPKVYDSSNNWEGEPFSGFKNVDATKADKFMISSASKEASMAAADIIKLGGNAIDAAIAAQMVLNVVEPHSSGIGGGAFLLYYDANKKNYLYYNGRETAPAMSNQDMFLDKNGNVRKFEDVVRGGLSVGTPGLLKMLFEVHEKYGRLPWKDLFLPAINLSKNGFIVNQRMYVLAKKISYLKDFKESRQIYLDKNSKPRKLGSIMTNKKLAKTFEIIASKGVEPFYNGDIARNIVNAVQNSKINKGFLSLEDLRNYKVKTGDLLCAKYRFYKVCSMPLPSAGGVTLLQTLGILENFDLKKYKSHKTLLSHLIIEASRLAYADRSEYVADNENIEIKRMIDKNYLKERSKLINLNKSIEDVYPGKISGLYSLSSRNMVNSNAKEMPSTTHISIVDNEGNAVSFTSSIEYFFGSALSVNGFLLNNQMTDFSLSPVIDSKLVANRVQPMKQPRSSMTPTFVFDDNDNLVLVVGSPGGPRITQFVLKTIIYYLDLGYDIQNAVSSPNFVVLNDIVELEKGTDIENLKEDLIKIGHKDVKIIDITSGVNAIAINDNNKKIGAADPRRQGFSYGE